MRSRYCHVGERTELPPPKFAERIEPPLEMIRMRSSSTSKVSLFATGTAESVVARAIKKQEVFLKSEQCLFAGIIGKGVV
jgi:hypothetical protein